MSARAPLQRAEHAALLGMTCGAALMLQPWWTGGLRAGFFVTAAFTLLHIVVVHRHREAA